MRGVMRGVMRDNCHSHLVYWVVESIGSIGSIGPLSLLGLSGLFRLS